MRKSRRRCCSCALSCDFKFAWVSMDGDPSVARASLVISGVLVVTDTLRCNGGIRMDAERSRIPLDCGGGSLCLHARPTPSPVALPGVEVTEDCCDRREEERARRKGGMASSSFGFAA